MAGCGIAMQIERSGRLQYAMQFDQAHGHHGEICHHVVFAQERPHGVEHIRGLGIAAVHHFIEGALGMLVPMPSILESLDLRLRLLRRSVL